MSDNSDLTVDDVAELDEELRFELVDGRFKPMPENLPVHQNLAAKVALAIDASCPRGFVVNFSLPIALDRRTQLCPDVVVFRIEGADRSPVVAADAILVAEVMSPASRAYDRGEKAELYARAGIPAYWLIDPLGERIVFTELLLGTTGIYEQQRRDDNLLTVLRPWPVTLDLPEWTRFRDDLRGAARKGG